MSCTVDVEQAIDPIRLLLGRPGGYVDRYVRWAVTQTEACPLYHVVSALAALSAVAPMNTRTTFGHGEQQLNLYGMIVGKSGMGRKSWSIGMSRALVEAVAPEVVGPAFGSYEAMVDELGERKKQITFDTEFSRLLAQSGQKGGPVTALKLGITDAFDGTTLTRRTRKDGVRPATGYRLSFLAAISDQYLELYSEPADFGGGFLSRWLFMADLPRYRWQGNADGFLYRPASRSKDEVEWLEFALRQVMCASKVGLYMLDREADERLYLFSKAVHTQVKEGADEYLHPLLARAQALVQRVAALYAVERISDLDPEPVDPLADWRGFERAVTVEDVETAIQVVNAHLMCAGDIVRRIAHTPEERLKRVVLAALEPEVPTSIGQITRRTNLFRRKAEEVLETLGLEDLVDRVEARTARGAQRQYIRRLPTPVDTLGTDPTVPLVEQATQTVPTNYLDFIGLVGSGPSSSYTPQEEE